MQLRKIYDRQGKPRKHLTELIPPEMVTAFAGGGGKTSLLRAYGEELAEVGNRVILTTTTHMLPYEVPLKQGMSLEAIPGRNGKLGPVPDTDGLLERCDYLLIEADGSRGLPVKAPGEREPVLTEKTGLLLVVFGLSGVGRPLRECCHRPEKVCRLLSKAPEDILEPEDLGALFLHPEGYLRSLNGRKYGVIFNQADGDRELSLAIRAAKQIPEHLPLAITAFE